NPLRATNAGTLRRPTTVQSQWIPLPVPAANKIMKAPFSMNGKLNGRQPARITRPAATAKEPFRSTVNRPPFRDHHITQTPYPEADRDGGRMAEVIGQHGWPGRNLLVGEHGPRAAWLVPYHAMGQPDLQRGQLAPAPRRTRPEGTSG